MSKLLNLSVTEREKRRVQFKQKKHYCRERYGELLSPYLNDHENLTFGEYVNQQVADHRKVLLLRHDVDHDYETALRMGEWEKARGLRSTYCVLHSAWYYGELGDGCYRHTDELIRLCRELADMGHEINLHNNAVVVALKTGLDPVQLLAKELTFFRHLGIEITGTSTHGDLLCREMDFRNYEIFSEAVSGKEGENRTLQSAVCDVQLGSVKMSELGLNYEAYDIRPDIYVSDSGGRLRCILNLPGRGRFCRKESSNGQVVVVLTHPVWWDFV